MLSFVVVATIVGACVTGAGTGVKGGAAIVVDVAVVTVVVVLCVVVVVVQLLQVTGHPSLCKLDCICSRIIKLRVDEVDENLRGKSNYIIK